MKIVLSRIVGPFRAALIVFGKLARKVLPGLIAGHEKAVVAFVAPLIVLRCAQWFGVHISLSMADQLVGAAITALVTHSTTNTVKP